MLGQMGGVWQVPVKAVKRWGEEYRFLQVEVPEIASQGRPGQFVMASPGGGTDFPHPLLKRALAIYDIQQPASGPPQLSLMVKVIGDGTRALAALQSGDPISLVGPLGNGFDLYASAHRHCLLVAGGIGIASFLLLARRLQELGREVTLIYGARSGSDLVGLGDFQSLGIPCLVTTDDGSKGILGRVTRALEARLSTAEVEYFCYVCGPNPMMESVAELCGKRGIPCQLSVESKMACGFGVCLGCTVLTTDGYRLACTHGPVFPAETFIWEGKGTLNQVSLVREGFS